METPRHPGSARAWLIALSLVAVGACSDDAPPQGAPSPNPAPPLGAPSPPAPVDVSRNPPGGLSASSIPQFIVITFDDGVNILATAPYSQLFAPNQNFPNPGEPFLQPDQRGGARTCGLMATWYATLGGGPSKVGEACTPANVDNPPDSACYLLEAINGSGHQLATHTCHHVSAPPYSGTSPDNGYVPEIQGAFEFFNAQCDIPMGDMHGFRNPNLGFTQATFDSLNTLAMGGTYQTVWDSSITEGQTNSLVPGDSGYGASFIFPYTLHDGIKQDCTAGAGSCDNSVKNAYIWEYPMTFLYYPPVGGADPQPIGDSMDPAPSPEASIKDFLDYNLSQHYNGNRAPMGIFLHGAVWLPLMDPGETKTRGEQLKEWMESVMTTYEDVYFVTVDQVLNWMENPVTAADYKLPECFNGNSCFPPVSSNPTYEFQGCVFGTLNGDTCVCDCYTSYCTDDEGACTVLCQGSN